ncbi:MAG TPA: hypothetical protein VGL22_05075 [Terracidiphilus sp.]|jgi:hypothetical protein
MNRNIFLGLALLLGSLSAAAQDKGYWRASSQTATSITGDLIIGESKITMNFLSWPLAPIRALTPVEISAVFDADSNVAQAGNLYRLNIAAAQKFMHKNTLCGTEQTQWMATWIDGRNLHVAFFSGSNMPVFTFEAVRNSPDLCGTFLYTR